MDACSVTMSLMRRSRSSAPFCGNARWSVPYFLPEAPPSTLTEGSVSATSLLIASKISLKKTCTRGQPTANRCRREPIAHKYLALGHFRLRLIVSR